MRFYDAETMRRARASRARPRPDGFGVAQARSTWPGRRRRARLSCASRSTCTSCQGAMPIRCSSRRCSRSTTRMDRRPRGRTGARHDAAHDRPAPARRDPRRRHGGYGRGLAAERTGMAGRLRVDHGLPARLETGWQGREQQGAERPDRGARPPLWIGYYENAFRLLRECYAELDRPRTDPKRRSRHGGRRSSPRTPRRSRTAAREAGITGSAEFSPNDAAPRRAGCTRARVHRPADTCCAALQLVTDFLDSLPSVNKG